MLSIVDRIRNLSNQRGLSITELEKKVGLGNGTIGKWAKQSPSCSKVKLVADFLSVSIDYLVNGTEEQKSFHSTITNSTNVEVNGVKNGDVYKSTETQLGETSQELLRVFEKLPIKERIRLMNIIYDYEDEYFKNN